MSDKFYVGRDLTGFEDNGKTRPVSRVTLAIDDDNVITAGDDSGYEITATCPHATQEMAEAILAKLKGYRYQMYTAEAANIDPAAELGDAVTVDGVYGVISRLSDDGGGYPDITAPGETELEDEFPMGDGPMTQEIKRQMGQTRSLITKTAEQIRLEVSEAVSGLSTSFNVKLEGITGQVSGLDGRVSTVEQTAGGLTSAVEGLDGKVTTAHQTADKIKWLVKSGESETDFTLTDRMAQLTAESIDLSGYVTFNSLKEGGTTEIDGSRITTGTINTERINLTGAITWDDLSSEAQGRVTTVEGILDNWKTVVNGTTYIDGGMVTSAVVAAKGLYGEEIKFVADDTGFVSGYLKTQHTTTGTGVGLWSTSGMRVCATDNLFLASHTADKGSGDPLVTGTTLTLFKDRIQTGFGPLVAGNKETLGTAEQPWGTIFSTSSSITVSDRNRKHDIEPLPEKYADMVNILEPVRFKYDDGASGRYHVGFIAQDVKAAMDALGIDSTEFGGYVADVDEDSNPIFLLRHEEFIGIIWAVLRKVLNRLNALEARYEH